MFLVGPVLGPVAANKVEVVAAAAVAGAVGAAVDVFCLFHYTLVC